MKSLVIVVMLLFSISVFAADPIVFKIRKPLKAEELKKKTLGERKELREQAQVFKTQFEKEQTAIVADIKKKSSKKEKIK